MHCGERVKFCGCLLISWICKCRVFDLSSICSKTNSPTACYALNRFSQIKIFRVEPSGLWSCGVLKAHWYCHSDGKDITLRCHPRGLPQAHWISTVPLSVPPFWTLDREHSLMVWWVKNPVAIPEATGDAGSLPGSERSPEREVEPTIVFLLTRFHRQRSLVGYSPWGR